MKNFILLFFVFLTISVKAQNQGILSGGFQSESQIYRDDESIGATSPDGKTASNNYLKLDYSINNLTFGIRYEAYLPPLLGYPQDFDGTGIANRYASYQNDFMKITAGNFYEQFGAGIVFRAFEERQLGVDNSVDGINVRISPLDGVDLIGIYGRQRNYFSIGEGTVRGIDGNIRLNDLLNLENIPIIGLGFSAVSKFENHTGPEEYTEIVDAYSGRFSLITNKINFDFEYVEKDIDPSASNNYDETRKGRALLINTGYSKRGLGINATFRRLENIDFRSERDASLTDLWLNFLPAETRQHGYLLPNIYPYAVQNQGEIGGQVNINYTIAKKSALGGKYGTKIALNYSQFNKLKQKVNPALSLESFNTNLFEAGDSLLYRDFNIEIKKKVNKNFSTTLSFISIEYNKFEIEGVPTENVKSQIGVVETLIKLPKRRSIRAEAQHLWTKEDKGNWAAALVEYYMAPHWTLFAFDQYNYGDDKKIHFYQVGFAYIKSATRISMRYGRQRGGLLCVGGVCRNVPSASGLNITIDTTF